MRIILVRHGETTWNIEGRYQGQEDTPLSERGLRQGHLLAEGLHHIPIDVCISSPLQRSYQTCKFCADLHKLPVATDERLLEINHGSWEGVLAPEIAKQFPQEFALWHTQPHLVQMPDGGESLEDVRKRARAAFDRGASCWTVQFDGQPEKWHFGRKWLSMPRSLKSWASLTKVP